MTLLLTILERLLSMSVTAAFVAVIVILLRLVLKRRAPKQIICLLWLVVFARLLIPVTVETPFSLVPPELDDFVYGQVEEAAEEPSAEAEPAPTQSAASNVPVLTPGVQAPVTQTPVVPQTPASAAPAVTPSVSAPPQSPTIVPPMVEDAPVEEPVAPEEPAEPAVSGWLYALPVVWLAGVFAMLVYGMASYLIMRRRVYAAVRCEDGAWEHHNLRAPFILGLFRPKIYLPMGISGQPRRFILQHERAHLRRGDHIVKPICWLALAIHWFNPLAWVAFLLLSRDIETACDESVIRQLGSEVKAEYSATLLALATNSRFPSPSPLSFGEGDAKVRIKNVLNFKKPALWVSIVAIVVVIVAAVCLLTDRSPDSPAHEGYTTDINFPGLYFQTVDEGTPNEGVMAYTMTGENPVLVAGYRANVANNFSTLIDSTGQENPIFADPASVYAQYEALLVRACLALNPDWRPVEDTAVWAECAWSALPELPEAEARFTRCLTPGGNLLVLCHGPSGAYSEDSFLEVYPIGGEFASYGQESFYQTDDGWRYWGVFTSTEGNDCQYSLSQVDGVVQGRRIWLAPSLALEDLLGTAFASYEPDGRENTIRLWFGNYSAEMENATSSTGGNFRITALEQAGIRLDEDGTYYGLYPLEVREAETGDLCAVFTYRTVMATAPGTIVDMTQALFPGNLVEGGMSTLLGELLYEDELISLYQGVENYSVVLLKYGSHVKMLDHFVFNPLRPDCTTWETDANRNGVNELYIVHTSGSGTGASVQTLTVCEPDGDELAVWYHDPSTLAEEFNVNRVASYDEASGLVTVGYNGKVLRIDPSPMPWDSCANPAVILGNWVHYTRNDNNTITMTMGMSMTSDESAMPHPYGLSVGVELFFNGADIKSVTEPWLVETEDTTFVFTVTPVGTHAEEPYVYESFDLDTPVGTRSFAGRHLEGETIGLYLTDLTGDGVGEYIVMLVPGYGTGPIKHDLHIFDGVTLEEHDTDGVWGLVPGLTTFSGDSGYYYIDAASLHVAIPKEDVLADMMGVVLLEKMDFMGEYCRLSVEGGKLRVTYNCKVADYWEGYGTLSASLIVVDGKLTAERIYYTAPDGAVTDRPLIRVLIDSIPEEGVYLYEDPNGGLILQDGDTIGPVSYVNGINNSHPGYFDLSKITITRKEDGAGRGYSTILLNLPHGDGDSANASLWWVEEDYVWDLAPFRSPGPQNLPSELVTQDTLPSDPNEYYLVAEIPSWYRLYARNYGQDSMLVWENFWWPLEGRVAHTSYLILPEMTLLDENHVAVVSHADKGTGVSRYELVVYGLFEDKMVGSSAYTGMRDYIYDWKPVAEEFNRNNTIVYRTYDNSITMTYNGKTYTSSSWNLGQYYDLENGFTGAAIADGEQVEFQVNDDGTISVRLGLTLAGSGEGRFHEDDLFWYSGSDRYYPLGDIGFSLAWTIRFTGGGFEVVDGSVYFPGTNGPSDFSGYEVREEYPGLYFRTATDPFSEITWQTAYTFVDGEAVRVARFAPYPENLFVGANGVETDYDDEPVMAWVLWEQALIDASMACDYYGFLGSLPHDRTTPYGSGYQFAGQVDNIVLYSLSDLSYGSLTLIRQGTDLQVVPYPSMGFHGDSPDLLWQDLDGDGEKELAVICNGAATGTHQYIDSLTVYEWDGGQWTGHKHDLTAAIDTAAEDMAWHVDDNGVLTVEFLGLTAEYSLPAYLQENWDELMPNGYETSLEPSYVYEYSVLDDKLTLAIRFSLMPGAGNLAMCYDVFEFIYEVEYNSGGAYTNSPMTIRLRDGW